ncbi:hypothetical protein [Gaopeijia maritima]|uniref:Small CPxCG-related zinc finger protein n=1 Tax=Gaopeijia maritima TaxID=3119007 RepID=A0ABU9EFC4_9BACT
MAGAERGVRPADPAHRAAEPAAAERVSDPESPAIVCECCGAEMFDRHCKVLCPNCGYQRDCSDP